MCCVKGSVTGFAPGRLAIVSFCALLFYVTCCGLPCDTDLLLQWRSACRMGAARQGTPNGSQQRQMMLDTFVGSCTARCRLKLAAAARWRKGARGVRMREEKPTIRLAVGFVWCVLCSVRVLNALNHTNTPKGAAACVQF